MGPQARVGACVGSSLRPERDGSSQLPSHLVLWSSSCPLIALWDQQPLILGASGLS